MTLWLPWAKRNVAPVTGGVWAAGYDDLILLIHTTETDTFTPDDGDYYGHQGWPHATNERDGTLWQHMDMDAPARALKNAPGGVQTNKARVVQIENVARAANGDAALTGAQIVTLRRLVVELRDKRGLKMVALPAGAIPGSARPTAPQRMSFAAWRTFGGLCGHRHAPENDHWDPGAFDLRRLLPTTTPAPTEEDEMGRTYLAQATGQPVYLMSDDQFVRTGVPTADALRDAVKRYGQVAPFSADFVRLYEDRSPGAGQRAGKAVFVPDPADLAALYLEFGHESAEAGPGR